ncbi:MAG: endonuclease MutS2 [Acetivibrio sp.]
MNEKVLKTLEYNKIIEQLTEFAYSSPAKELCRNLLPMDSLLAIQTAQTETSDGLSRLLKKGTLSFSGVKDIRPSLMRLDVGSSLNAAELLQLSSLLNVALRVKAYSRNETCEEGEGLDSLSGYFQEVEPLTPLNNEIKRCILSEEDISDDASPQLHHIRRTVKNVNNKIHEQLNSIVNASTTQTMLQENIVTMRNGRYCLPIKSEYKNHFSGMIHDQSSSGSTLFVEPMAIVKLNNELRELDIQEKEEIEKILANLSNECASFQDALKSDLDVLIKLDFVFAKAVLSKKLKATEPIFNENGYIHIKKGRHPLIDSKKVVPIDVYLGKDFNLLIVTGPNTGGKTVSLKTVGLFTLMGQAGLHIPAFDRSELCVFEEVYADIGDEQSIEQSLSTFSSHMVNTVSILQKANFKSLVLFDELGAGTDPTEGAALAMSILSYLHKQQIRTMATTHYSELKIFALSTPGVENACCEFDVESLRPTYRLLIGIPGKSNAFAISGKLGLPHYIIQNAKEFIGVQDQSFEDVIHDLEISRVTIQKEQEEVLRYKTEIENLKKKLEQKNQKLEESKDKILRNANEEAREIIQKAKDFADESIRKYNKWLDNGHSTKEMEKERAALRDKLGEKEASLTRAPKKNGKVHKSSDFKLGDTVHVTSLDLKGTVRSLPNDKGDLFVQMGILRSQVNIKDLELIEESTVANSGSVRTGSGQIKMSKSSTIRPDINLIGKTVDEALPLLDKYLDDAYLSHLPQVTVIHGRGTGALKNAVHTHLKKTKYVKSFRIGTFGEGDQGVTIVEFKA